MSAILVSKLPSSSVKLTPVSAPFFGFMGWKRRKVPPITDNSAIKVCVGLVFYVGTTRSSVWTWPRPPETDNAFCSDHPRPNRCRFSSSQTAQTDEALKSDHPRPTRKIRSNVLQQKRTISMMFFITVLLKDYTLYGLLRSGKSGIKLKSRD